MSINQLYLKAALACKKVYKKNIDLGTTEFDIFTYPDHVGGGIQILAIAGTNELKDWGKNFNLWSKKGIKKSAYDAAIEIFGSDYFKDNRARSLPLIVTGHSKAGATAIAFNKLPDIRYSALGSAYCIAFAPARCLRYWANRKMENATIFTDPDDPVSFFGRLNFGHPKCKTFKSSNNYFGFKVSDHYIDSWIEHCQNM